jgi:hypothetical protein
VAIGVATVGTVIMMRVGTGLWVAVTVAALTGIALLFDLPLNRIAAYLGTISFCVLVVSVVIEWRRRSKRFSQK